MSERAMTNTRETLAGIREHAGNVTVVRMAEALEAVLDLADQFDAESEAAHDFYGWPRYESEHPKAPASRIREVVAAKLKGQTDD